MPPAFGRKSFQKIGRVTAFGIQFLEIKAFQEIVRQGDGQGRKSAVVQGRQKAAGEVIIPQRGPCAFPEVAGIDDQQAD